MSKYLPLSTNDLVCVALSGGKDSMALLYNLYLRYNHTKSPKLMAITVDEGISNTFSHNLERIDSFFKKIELDIPLIQTSYKDVFGVPLDKIVQKIQKDDIKLNACTVCASIRRRIINELARKNGANLIAIGHNLDDIAQSIIMNILRNDIVKIENTTPFSSFKENIFPFLPRIKPLFLFTEEEVLKYCTAVPLPFYSKTCQYSLEFPILRKKVQKFLNDLDKRSHEYKYNLIKLHLSLNQKLTESATNSPSKNICPICSYPTGTNRKICTYCEFKQMFSKS
jgi:uncharacterized protein (TIGR00269 family)